MKKTYIIPGTQILNIEVKSAMLQVSVSTTAIDRDNAGLVKEDRGGRGSRSDYNVWNDDWSQ